MSSMVNDRKKIWLKETIQLARDYRHMLESRLDALPATRANRAKRGRLKRAADYADLHALFFMAQLEAMKQKPQMRITR